MAATYAVQILTGSGPTFTTVTSIRLRTDDANTADLTNPCIIGASLTYSYRTISS